MNGMSFTIYSWHMQKGNNNDKTTMQQIGEISPPLLVSILLNPLLEPTTY